MTLHYLADMTYPQVQNLMEKTDIALLPTGPTEVHGPHLPLYTDVYEAQEMTRRVAKLLWEKNHMESLIAPPINYAVADLAMSHPGNTTLRPQTMAMMVEDVLLSLAHWGFKRVAIISGHAEPANNEAIEAGFTAAMAKSPGLQVFNSGWFGLGVQKMGAIMECDHPTWDLHAGEMETSMMLWLKPDLVKKEAYENLEANWKGEHLFENVAAGMSSWVEVGAPLAYMGDPAKADADKGDKLYDLFADIIYGEIQENFSL